MTSPPTDSGRYSKFRWAFTSSQLFWLRFAVVPSRYRTYESNSEVTTRSLGDQMCWIHVWRRFIVFPCSFRKVYLGRCVLCRRMRRKALLRPTTWVRVGKHSGRRGVPSTDDSPTDDPRARQGVETRCRPGRPLGEGPMREKLVRRRSDAIVQWRRQPASPPATTTMSSSEASN